MIMQTQYSAKLTDIETNQEVMTFNCPSDLNHIIDLLEDNKENGIKKTYRLHLERWENKSVDIEAYFNNDKIDEMIDIIAYLEDWEGSSQIDVMILSAINQHISCLYEFCEMDTDEIQWEIVNNFGELALTLAEDGVLGKQIPEELRDHIDWESFEDYLKVGGWFIEDGYAINDSNI